MISSLTSTLEFDMFGKHHDIKHLFSSSTSRRASQARKIESLNEKARRADRIQPGAGDKHRKSARKLARKMIK